MSKGAYLHPISDDKALEFLFLDRIRTIEFAKVQMWDVFKWGVSIQVSIVGFTALLGGKASYWLCVLPLVVGGVVYFLLMEHTNGLEQSRNKLSKIRKMMNELMVKIIAESDDARAQKRGISGAYFLINGISSIVTFVLVGLIMRQHLADM
jgi:hypothetical protein